jgi:hypothetical protein
MFIGFEAFKAVISQVNVFWVVTPCSVVVGYRRFRDQRYSKDTGSQPGRPQRECPHIQYTLTPLLTFKRQHKGTQITDHQNTCRYTSMAAVTFFAHAHVSIPAKHRPVYTHWIYECIIRSEEWTCPGSLLAFIHGSDYFRFALTP